MKIEVVVYLRPRTYPKVTTLEEEIEKAKQVLTDVRVDGYKVYGWIDDTSFDKLHKARLRFDCMDVVRRHTNVKKAPLYVTVTNSDNSDLVFSMDDNELKEVLSVWLKFHSEDSINEEEITIILDLLVTHTEVENRCNVAASFYWDENGEFKSEVKGSNKFKMTITPPDYYSIEYEDNIIRIECDESPNIKIRRIPS